MLALISAVEVLDFVLDHQYFAMFGVLFLCGCGLPIPEEITLIASGVVVGFGRADFVFASLTCVAAILAGDTVIFFAGRFVGRRFPRSRFVRLINNRKVRRFFSKHGKKTVFFARFFAGVRLGVYAYAGQHGMRWYRFIVLDLLGALISGPTSVWIGKYAAERLGDTPDEALERAQDLLHRYEPYILVGLGVLIAGIAAFTVWKARSLRTQMREAPADSTTEAALSTSDTKDAPRPSNPVQSPDRDSVSHDA